MSRARRAMVLGAAGPGSLTLLICSVRKTSISA